MPEETFDAIVIGAGPAGEVCAGRLTELGLSCALVERELVGGECSFYACMPSKALLRAPQLLDEVPRVPGAREAVTGELDVQAVLDRRDEVIHDLDDSVQLPWIEDRGIELVRGEGRITGEREVTVGDRVLRAERALVIATGTGALIPPIDGLREIEPWTNRAITTAKKVPGRLIVLGGGVVGVEMAQAYARLGARVALVEALPRLISREEEFASEQVLEALKEHGVEVHLGQKAVRAERANGTVTLGLEDGSELEGDEILVAIGRVPHTADLGLEDFGLEGGKTIETDEHLRSSVPWIYAIGDANGRALLTHMGKYQAAIAAEHIAGRADAKVVTDGPTSPRVIFTEPQVAAVGHTVASARDAGIDVRTVEHASSGTAGGSFIGRNAAGTSQLVIDTGRDVLVGATFTGVEVADWVHAASIAIVAEIPLATLRHAVPSFPTRSEVWLRLLDKARVD